MPPASSNVARVEQDGPSKVPILTEGDPSLETMQEFENGCQDYFQNKEIAKEKQTGRILPGFKDPCIQAHINANRAHLMALPFSDLMAEFRELYLAPDWEEDLRHKLMGMSMSTGTFWEYMTKIQNQNILLIGMNSHLAEDKLRHQLEVGMMDRLAKKCKNEKVQDVVEFCKWLLDVKWIDDAMRTNRLKFEEIAGSTRNESRKTNPMGEPSHRANVSKTSNYNTNVGNSKGGTGNAKPTPGRLPKLTEDKRTLLYNNSRCLKCRRPFLEHRMAD
jgi:hypothetical protein